MDTLGFHSYASRIGSKQVDGNTVKGLLEYLLCFHSYASRIGSKLNFPQCPRQDVRVSIHTLHELEARIAYEMKWQKKMKRFHSYASRIGSKPQGGCGDLGEGSRFHSYASRIGSKTSFAKLGCTRIVQRFFVGY